MLLDNNIRDRIINLILENPNLNIEIINDDIERRIYEIIIDILIKTPLITHLKLIIKKIYINISKYFL